MYIEGSSGIHTGPFSMAWCGMEVYSVDSVDNQASSVGSTNSGNVGSKLCSSPRAPIDSKDNCILITMLVN